MHTVRLIGWDVGLKKISLNYLLQDMTGMSVKEAHRIVNQLLDNETIDLSFNSEAAAQQFIEKARNLGARCDRGE